MAESTEISSQGWLDDDPQKWPANVQPPSDVGVDKSGNYYAYQRTYTDGRRVIEWYKRGSGGGPGQPDPIVTTTTDTLPGMKKDWDDAQAKAAADARAEAAATRSAAGGVTQEGATRGPQTGPHREVYRNGQWVTEDNPTYNGPTAAQGGTVGSNPRVPPGSIPRIEGTPDSSKPGGYDNSQPIRAWHTPSGAIVYEPLEADARLKWERDKNGGLTDAEVAARQVAQQGSTKREPDATHPGYDVVTTVVPATATSPGRTESHYEKSDAPGVTVPTPGGLAKDVPSSVLGPDGKTYTLHTVTKVDGTPGETYYTLPGSTTRVAFPTVAPETPTAPAPQMPNFVLGGSKAALTQYQAALLEGVKNKQWTDKWAHDRWAEAMQMAQQVNQDYATQNSHDQSFLNATINLATSRANLNQNALTTALDAVNKLNGLLPEGSPLGGQAFAALLGIGMLNQARSGINSIDPTARPQQPLPTITPATLSNPQAMATAHAAVADQVSAAAQAAAGPTPPLNQGQDMSTPGGLPPVRATPAAPVSAAATAAPAPAAPTAPGPPPAAITGEQAAAYERGGINPATGDIDVRGTPPSPSPSATPLSPPPPLLAPYQDSQTAAAPPASPLPPPDFGAGMPAYPGGPPVGPTPRVLPYPSAGAPMGAPVAPSSYGDAEDTQGRAPSPPMYPVLAQYRPAMTGAPLMPTDQPTQPPWGVLGNYPPPTAGQPSSTPLNPPVQAYPAALHSQAAATPFWQMTPEEYQRYVDAGVPQGVIEGPGRRAA